MRYFILILFTVVSISTNGQEIKMNPDTGMYESQGVVEIEGKSKDELFNSALEWIVLNYNSANDVIQFKDKESGKIILKGNYTLNLYGKTESTIGHTLLLEFKEGKFRNTFSGFTYRDKYSGYSTFEEEQDKHIITTTEELIHLSIEDITRYIRKKSKESEW